MCFCVLHHIIPPALWAPEQNSLVPCGPNHRSSGSGRCISWPPGCADGVVLSGPVVFAQRLQPGHNLVDHHVCTLKYGSHNVVPELGQKLLKDLSACPGIAKRPARIRNISKPGSHLRSRRSSDLFTTFYNICSLHKTKDENPPKRSWPEPQH